MKKLLDLKSLGIMIIILCVLFAGLGTYIAMNRTEFAPGVAMAQQVKVGNWKYKDSKHSGTFSVKYNRVKTNNPFIHKYYKAISYNPASGDYNSASVSTINGKRGTFNVKNYKHGVYHLKVSFPKKLHKKAFNARLAKK